MPSIISKPLPKLDHLPWNVKKLIVSSTDLMTRLCLRKCSTEFRKLVQELPLVYSILGIQLFEDRDKIQLKFCGEVGKTYTLEFIPRQNGCTMIKGNWRSNIKGVSAIRMAIMELESLIGKRRVTVKRFWLDVEKIKLRKWPLFPTASVVNEYHMARLSGSDHGEKLLVELISAVQKRNGHRFHVEAFILRYSFEETEILELLTCFEPVILKEIVLDALDFQSIAMVTSTKQWEGAKTVKLNSRFVEASTMLHFTSINTRSMTSLSNLSGYSVSDMVQFVKAAQRHGTQYRKSWLTMSGNDHSEFENYLSQFPRSQEKGWDSWHLAIPTSSCYLKVSVSKPVYTKTVLISLENSTNPVGKKQIFTSFLY